jgi:hypothetical protein
MMDHKELRKLLHRNNTWHDAKKMAEEEGRFAREPLGDWQSPSDSERWENLRYALETVRLKHNISASTNKEEELHLMQRQKWIIEEMLEEHQRNSQPTVEFKKTFAQNLYHLFFRAEERVVPKAVIDESDLRNLLRDINRQIPFYFNTLE